MDENEDLKSLYDLSFFPMGGAKQIIAWAQRITVGQKESRFIFVSIIIKMILLTQTVCGNLIYKFHNQPTNILYV